MKATILAALISCFLCLSASGQTLDLAGPDEMGRCETATFTILLTNDTAQTLSQIVITETRPNPNFIYVQWSASLTLHDGSVIFPAEPSESELNLVWDLDSILGNAYELPPDSTLKIEFDLATNCNTVSGTHQAQATGEGFTITPTDSQSVEILPGAVRIYKEPSVITAHVGETVTWTIRVESTGLGPIYNVVVTDTLGSGLSFVSAAPAPDEVDGQVITWNLGSIPAGESREITLQAEVTACSGLNNNADVRFGCEDSVCFDTALQGGTATASILLIVDNPLLEFTPPTIQIPYCDPDGTTVTMRVANNGTGPAKNVQICVNFPATLQVQNVQGGASWDGSCFRIPDIPAEGYFDLTFDLVYTGNWCGGGPSGTLYWQAIYYNVCGEEFRPPAVFSTYGTSYDTAGPPSLSVSLSGDDQVYICTEHTYDLAVSFSGLTTCGNGATGAIDVTVYVPQGFLVLNSGGGRCTPGEDGTGGTITWTGLDPSSGLSTSLTLRAPGTVQCGEVANLTATATATDCCGCVLSASDSIPIAIECYQLVTATRQASPTTQEKCGTITYTNTYVFVDDPALDGISFDELVFTESAANNQNYVEGSLQITIDGNSVNPITVFDNTPGGPFVIQGIDDTRSVRGHTLVISYQMTFTEASWPTACPNSYTFTFYDWATLDLGPDCATGDQCTEPCQATEVLRITTATPSMSVSITGLPNDFVDPCGTYNVTVALTKTSDFDPHNVKLRLESLNYYIVDLSSISCSGVCPTSTIPADYGTYYEWDYGDAFVGKPNGSQSVLRFQVRKRCNLGRDLTAVALFEDSCGYSSCSVSASVAPAVMREPLLYIYKTPEVIYATRNTVTWVIYVTNGGAGPAYEVWVDDVFGSGLVYQSSAVDPDVTVTPDQDHTGAPINGVSWHIPVIDPGRTRKIQVTARLVACAGLTDIVKAGLGCGGEECVTPVSDTAYVLIPNTVVVATSSLESTMPVCQETTANISIRNAGDPAVYHLVARMTLPPGIEYVQGSTEWRLGGGAWNSGSDPVITGDPWNGYTLEWDETKVSGLSELLGRSTIVIQFRLRPICHFNGGYFEAYVDYENVCGDSGTYYVGKFFVGAVKPEISVSKRQADPPAGNPIDCGGSITWEITVKNIGNAVADYVWIEDTLGDGFVYVSSSGDGVYAVDDGANSGQVVTWVLEDLPPGASATLTLTAWDNGTCRDLTNTVEAWWGCGDDPDGSSATNDADCLTDTPATFSLSASRTPAVSLSASLDPSSIPACGIATITVTVENTSTTTATAIDVGITLPSGLSYVENSTEVDCGTGFSYASDPSVSGQNLIWYNRDDPNENLCSEIPPGGKIRLRFQVKASCYTNARTADLTVWFYDCCLEAQLSTTKGVRISPALPRLEVTKGPPAVALDCYDQNSTVTWQIHVQNTGAASADWVRVEDTLGASLEYVSSSPNATPMGAQKWGWEFGPLGPGESRTFEITVRLIQPENNCATALRTNTVSVWWGCGQFDGDPNTADGCTGGGPVTATALVTIPDLAMNATDIIPLLTCLSDGNYNGAVQITVRNLGDADVTRDFRLTLSEAGSGWSVSGLFGADFGGALPIPAGEARTITIPDWPVTCGQCTYTFTVNLDAENVLCECREDNNSAVRSWTITLPDLTVPADTLALTCAGDGQVRIAGTVTIWNRGCGDPFTGNIPVRFTLRDAAGCTGKDLHTWTETFTGVNIPAGGEQTFVVSHAFPINLCTIPGCNVSLLIEADYMNSICECDGTNNSRCVDLPVDIPDLTVSESALTIACADDDLVRILGTITVENLGCGSNFTGDIPVRFTLYSDPSCTGRVIEQWTEQLTGVNIPAKGTQAFTIEHVLGANICTAAGDDCMVSLRIELDYTNSICECNGTNNNYCTELPFVIPDLAVISVSPNVPNACNPGEVAITVRNVGCATSPSGIPVWITGDASGEITLPALPPGEATTVTVTLNKALPCGVHNITAIVDPNNFLCECTSENNSMGASFSVVDPDLAPGNLRVVCNGDDTYNVRVTVLNQGTEGAPLAKACLYIDGNLVHTWTVPSLAIEEYVELEFLTDPLKCGQEHTFRVVVDEGDLICECNEQNNEIATIASCPCPALVTSKEILRISRGGIPVNPSLPIQPGDVITYKLSVTNVGGGKAFDVDISDALPVEFLYISGSTSASWPSGSYATDPAGAPGPNLFWNTSAELWPGETLALEFQAVVTSAVIQGQIYTNSMCATGKEGDGTAIPPDMSPTIPADTDPDDCSSVSHVATAVPALSVNKEIVDVIRNGVSIWPTNAVEPGDLIHYRFTIRNVGEGIAYDVNFTDELPAGLEYDTDYAPGTYTVDSPAQAGSLGISDGATGRLVANISATIDGGGKLVADFYAYVTSAVQQGVDLWNYAMATGKDGYGTPIPPENREVGDVSDDDPEDADPDDTGLAVIGVHEPALALKKRIVDVLRGGVSIWPTEIVLPEDVIVYRVEVGNVGLGTAYDVDFSDILPEGLEYDTAYGAGTYNVDSPPQAGSLGIPGGAMGTVYADISVQLAPGATLVIVYRTRVRPDARPGAILENMATATGKDGAGSGIPEFNPDTRDSYPDRDSTRIRVGIPALVTRKEIYLEPCACEPPSLLPGTEVQFLLTVKNVGYSTAYDIVVRDLLPDGLTYIPETSRLTIREEIMRIEPMSTPDGRLLVWNTGLSLKPGEALEIMFLARIGEDVPLGMVLENKMMAEGVDDLSRPIPTDASPYVPADTDPDDSSALQFKVGDPNWGPPPCRCPCPKGGE